MRRIALSMILLCLAVPGAQAQNSFGGPPPAVTSPGTPQTQPPASSPAQGKAPNAGAAHDALGQAERQDFGVPPKKELHAGEMHGPTPASIPGGQVITTQGLVDLRGKQARALVFDVLGGPETLPGALPAVPAHRPGAFDDATQREFGQFLQQVTQGQKDTPLVFYCQSTQCWMSYNASLRAIRLGYTQVLWYRGGLEAWKRAGQSVQAARGAGTAQGPAR